MRESGAGGQKAASGKRCYDQHCCNFEPSTHAAPQLPQNRRTSEPTRAVAHAIEQHGSALAASRKVACYAGLQAAVESSSSGRAAGHASAAAAQARGTLHIHLLVRSWGRKVCGSARTSQVHNKSRRKRTAQRCSSSPLPQLVGATVCKRTLTPSMPQDCRNPCMSRCSAAGSAGSATPLRAGRVQWR